jgi:hypothetical protein
MKRFKLALMFTAVAMMLSSIAVAGDQATRRTPPARNPPATGRTTQPAPPRTTAPPRTPRQPSVVAPHYRYRPYAYDAYRYGLQFYYGLPYAFPYDDWYWYDYPQYRYPPPYYGWGDRFGAYGTVRLEIPQKEAFVYADGYFMGTVDEFDGAWTPLVLPVGPHRIDVRGAGYEVLTFDVYVRANRTFTYRGSLIPIQPAGPVKPTTQ